MIRKKYYSMVLFRIVETITVKINTKKNDQINAIYGRYIAC
jgi:hypothetical protein